MSVRVHLPQNGLDSRVRGDDEGGALSTKLSAFPAFGCRHPDIIRSHNAFFRVTDQREWQGVEFDKLPMTLRRIDADTEKAGSAAELGPRVAKLACLGRASRRMVLRIEIEDDLFVKVIAESKRLPVGEFATDRDTRKIRGGIARRKCSCANIRYSFDSAETR